MAQITITIPDNIAARVINGFAVRYGYSNTLENGEPNPETKAQFCKRIVIQFIKQAVKEAEIQAATNAVAAVTAASADTDIQLS